jgi:hypothetical protein
VIATAPEITRTRRLILNSFHPLAGICQDAQYIGS